VSPGKIVITDLNNSSNKNAIINNSTTTNNNVDGNISSIESNNNTISNNNNTIDEQEEARERQIRLLMAQSVDASELEDVLSSLPVGLASTDQLDEEKFHFALSDSFQGRNGTDDTISVIEDQGANRLLRAKTSVELMSLMQECDGQDDKIANFLVQLKAGEVQTKQLSDFRQRRLTYEKEHEVDMNSVSSNNASFKSAVYELGISGGGSTGSTGGNDDSGKSTFGAKMMGGNSSGSLQSQTIPRKSSLITSASLPPKMTRSRTSIFSSGEIGVVHKKQAPFPDTVLGTYSCHGIEPAPDEEDGKHLFNSC
jgi:hypothetical protein